MDKFLDKIFFRSRNLDYISQNLKDITNQTPANKIFEAINNYSESSEVRYVGGCIRKVINKEIVDDIDLATNLKPNEICEALKNKDINFYETGIEHGTVTAVIDEYKYEITSLRKDVKTVWIHRGNYPFGGGNNNLLIHTDYSELNYEEQGILEETLIHEAAHTSLDAYHAENSLWLDAQNADCSFISSYAEEHPLREDIAESFLPYFAIRYRSDRISEELKISIESTISNRIEYFDNQNFNMYPVEKRYFPTSSYFITTLVCYFDFQNNIEHKGRTR